MLLSLLFLALVPPAGTIHGTVRAEASREPIAYAVVEIAAIGRRVMSDQHGYFVLAGVPPGSWEVSARALGHRPTLLEAELADQGSTRLDFLLAVQPLGLAGVEVVAGRPPAAGTRAGPPGSVITPIAIQRLPAVAESDVFRAVQSLPAVAAISDFSSALYVRGGAPDQNLLLLDGAPLFNPYHLGGLFAAIDPDAVASVEVLPGAFPAPRGDRLASVINIWTRDGGRDRVRGHGSLGLVSSRAGVDGPLPGGRGSYLVSARRTYLDLFTSAAAAAGLIEQTLPYSFTDAHLKVTQDIGRDGRLSAAGYLNDERFRYPSGSAGLTSTDWVWGSRAASLRFRQPLGGAVLVESWAAASTFRGSLLPPGSAEEAGERRDSRGARTTLRDVLAGGQVTWHLRTHELRAGLQLDRYLLDHDIREGIGLDAFLPPLRRTDRPRTLAAYVEDEWSPNDAFRVRGGVRVLDVVGAGTVWMPRMGVSVQLAPAWALQLGAGRSAQAVHTLRDEEAFGASLFAYDLLVAATADIGIPTADDIVLGVAWTHGTTQLRVDAYAKRMRNLALPPLPAVPGDAPVLVTDGWRRGGGHARGVELQASHERGRGGAWVSYALSLPERELDGLRYVPRFARRHTVDLTAALPLGARGQASARLVAGSGQPYTPGVSLHWPLAYDAATGSLTAPFGAPTVLLGEYNAGRLPGYLRLDMAARTTVDRAWLGRSVSITPYLNLINVLATPNVLWGKPAAESRQMVVEYGPQLPILPTAGLEWRF